MRRHPQNPLIAPKDVKSSRSDCEVLGAFNPGVTRFGEETILLVRVAERPRDRADGWLVSPSWNAEAGEVDVLRVRADDPDVGDVEERAFTYKGRMRFTSLSHLRLACSNEPILVPQTEYEMGGFFGGVIFASGATVVDGQVTLYYGASDDTTAAASASVDGLLAMLP